MQTPLLLLVAVILINNVAGATDDSEKIEVISNLFAQLRDQVQDSIGKLEAVPENFEKLEKSTQDKFKFFDFLISREIESSKLLKEKSEIVFKNLEDKNNQIQLKIEKIEQLLITTKKSKPSLPLLNDSADLIDQANISRKLSVNRVLSMIVLTNQSIAYGGINEIRIWDPNNNNNNIFKTLKANGYVECLAELSGERLASGSNYGHITVWDLKKSQQNRTLKGHADSVKCLSVLEQNRIEWNSLEYSFSF